MKREIKFRAWDIKNNLMMPVEKWTDSWVMVDPPNNDDEGNYSYELDNDDCILMQYTGLKEKNGKAAYDGDVLKHPSYGTGKIEWCDTEASFLLDFNEGGGEMLEDWMFTMEVLNECEIIGNIHENPELIK